jgi:hypothetical protein
MRARRGDSRRLPDESPLSMPRVLGFYRGQEDTVPIMWGLRLHDGSVAAVTLESPPAYRLFNSIAHAEEVLGAYAYDPHSGRGNGGSPRSSPSP